MNVITHCEELVAVSAFPRDIIKLYEGSKAELLQYARLQVYLIFPPSKNMILMLRS